MPCFIVLKSLSLCEVGFVVKLTMRVNGYNKRTDIGALLTLQSDQEKTHLFTMKAAFFICFRDKSRIATS
jgi:hypothetical protein